MRDQLLAGLAAARQGRPGMAPHAGTAIRNWLKAHDVLTPTVY